MAIVNATKTGNWSDTTVWSSGALPQSGDTVRSLTYTVTIDQNFNIDAGTLEATGSGYFSITVARTITANVLSSTGHSGGGVVRCTHTTGTVTITGNITAGANVGISNGGAGTLAIGGNVIGGSSASAYGLSNVSTGIATITGNVTGGSGTTSYGAVNLSSGTLTIVGGVTGGSVSGAHGARNSASGGILNITGNVVAVQGTGVSNNSSGTVNITGNVTGGSTTGAYGAVNESAGTMIITGSVTGGSSTSSYGAHNAATGTLRVGTAVGNDYGPLGSHSNSVPGLSGSNNVGAITTYKKLKFGAHGQSPVQSCAYLELSASNNTAQLYITDTTFLTLTDPATFADSPTQANVRQGIVYDNGNKTGTCYVPAANQVSVGTNVDNTVGTAVLTAETLRAAIGLAAANLDTQLADLPTAIENADATLGRSVSNVENTASLHSLAEIILAILESSAPSTTWTIKKTDGSTTFNTRTLTEDANALPVTGVS